jgi:hypothetical protein
MNLKHLIILTSFLFLISCGGGHRDSPFEKILDGANLVATCNNGEEKKKSLGYGNFIVQEKGELSAQKMCSGELKDLKIVYKKAHINVKIQKENGTRIIPPWTSAGDEPQIFNEESKYLTHKIRIQAIPNTEPKPIDADWDI